jgi:hypothetical protein
MFVALDCGCRDRRAKDLEFLRPMSLYACLDADHVEGGGNSQSSAIWVALGITRRTNPEMSEPFREMSMMWFAAGVIRSSIIVEEGEALAHEASTPK